MITPQSILEYVRAEPFRPFRIHMASGRVFEIRHPEVIRVLRSSVLVFSLVRNNPDIPDEFHNVSLMLTESVSPIEAPVS